MEGVFTTTAALFPAPCSVSSRPDARSKKALDAISLLRNPSLTGGMNADLTRWRHECASAGYTEQQSQWSWGLLRLLAVDDISLLSARCFLTTLYSYQDAHPLGSHHRYGPANDLFHRWNSFHCSDSCTILQHLCYYHLCLCACAFCSKWI